MQQLHTVAFSFGATSPAEFTFMGTEPRLPTRLGEVMLCSEYLWIVKDHLLQDLTGTQLTNHRFRIYHPLNQMMTNSLSKPNIEDFQPILVG